MAADPTEVMTWQKTAMAMGVGGLAALFAIGIKQPDSRREGLFRVGFGIFITFVSTEFVLNVAGYPPTVNNVLMYALLIGSVGWFFFGAFVRMCMQSPLAILRGLAKLIIGPNASALIPPDQEEKK